MKALVFAAGLGTRLRPLTDTLPKALVPICGEPMLKRVIMRLAEAGFTDITVNVHHFADLIIDYLKENRNFGLDIHISDERELLLDTGGGVKKARRFLDGDEPFLVHNADILSDVDLKSFYEAHLRSKADVSLLVSARQTSRYFVFDKKERLKGWINHKDMEVRPGGFEYQPGSEKAQQEGLHELAFGGMHVISPSIFPLLEPWEGKFSIVPFYLANCGRLDIRGYRSPEAYSWFDVGNLETHQKAEDYLRSKNHQ